MYTVPPPLKTSPRPAPTLSAALPFPLGLELLILWVVNLAEADTCDVCKDYFQQL